MYLLMYKSVRLYYLDILKFIAIFGVIFIHLCGFSGHGEILNFRIVYFSEIFRFAVPVFLMITGALLLNKEISISNFLKKRFSRIVYPYLFWIMITIITFLYVSGSLLQDYPLIIINQFFNASWSWYFWMILGVYLCIPIINEFVLNKKLDGCKYIVILMIFASIFYTVCTFLGYKTFFELRFFVLPISYVILGYFLANYEFKISKNKIIFISIMLFLISTLLKLSFHDSAIFFSNENIFLDSGLDINFLEIIQASSIFLLFKNLNYSILDNNKIKSFVTSISRASYGMYLAHIVILIPISQIFKSLTSTGTQTLLSIILLSIAIFFVTWLLVLFVDKILKLHKFSGYH